MKQKKAYLSARQGFTLIETLVAISILVVAVTAPLSLASQSLFASFYAKDQVTAAYLAQEAIEIIRQKRDHNIMLILESQSTIPIARTFWVDGIITSGDSATLAVDAKDLSINSCSDINSSCAVLKTDGDIYNHSTGANSRFSRIVTIERDTSPTGNINEIEVSATVRWQTGSFVPRTFTIKESLYNWLPVTP